MQIHNIQRHTKRKYGIKVGRGGKRGKSSGRGTKGQKARAGHKMRPEIRDIIKRMPKLRGRGVNSNKPLVSQAEIVNLGSILKVFPNGGEINPKILADARLVRKVSGLPPKVKILGTGDITVKYTISGCSVSASAQKKITAAGGTIEGKKTASSK